MKSIALLIGVLLISFNSYACDNCNVYLSINPSDYQHSFGIQYRTRMHYGSFSSLGTLQLKHGGTTSEFISNEVEERYRRVELTGNYFFNPKWNLQVVLPYVQNLQIVDTYAKYNLGGIGDPILIQNYQLFNSKDKNDSVPVIHRVKVGLGVKVPLGKTNQTFVNGTPNIDLQTGTGSWDGILNLSYLFKFKKFGFVNIWNYKINSANKEQFRYGNSMNVLADVFYQQKIGKMILMPAAGVYAELAEKDWLSNSRQETSGGNLLFLDMSLSIFIGNVRVQSNYQPTLISQLNNETQLRTLRKWSFSLVYNF